MPLYVITWLHLVAAIMLIGGLMFLHWVLKPALGKLGQPSQGFEVLRLAGRKFRTLAWVSLITLILTGAYQMLNESGSVRIETTWGVVLMVKLFVFAIAFGLFLIHDFILDPFSSVSNKADKADIDHRSSTQATLIQQAILVLTLAILFIASYLTSM